jgi:putative spermidine/putrescine transport system permease protein
LIETGIFAPLIFPHAAIGVAMLGFLLALHARGTMLGIMLVHVILCGPFAYRPVSVSLQNIDRSMAEAAMSLGADPRGTFRRVILPLMRPGIVTALIFAFILSFDEATVTLFLISPDITTLPVRIYSRVRDAADPVVPAISTLLVIITLTLVILLERTVGLQLFVNPGKEE